MPAALFMTLVRTLVRATVQDIDSPSQVLARVNDLLTPDAEQGMFVTLIYSVLSLETGELIYANAGHNPPLLFRNDGSRLERLEKGGMALGVLEGNRIKENKVQFNSGDCLIFYTDGVTEAFSPQGEMYGEAHLRQAILDAGTSSAEIVLKSIDNSVCRFTADCSLADDLTLMVLTRK
jgi:serine phosphatase RsbU (regulator of sigma subunit)